MVDDSWYLKRPHLQQDLILIIIILSPYCYRPEALNYEACLANTRKRDGIKRLDRFREGKESSGFGRLRVQGGI